MSDDGNLRDNPTKLTTEKIEREVGLQEKIVETRLSAMDKAIRLLQTFADKSPTTGAVDQAVRELRILTQEQFKGVESLLAMRDNFDVRMAEVKSDYEKRIADILERQSDKSALLLSGTVDKLGATTNERISLVEKNQYVRGGETSVSDPAMHRLLQELTSKVDDVRGTKSEGVDKTWGVVAVVITLVISGAVAFVTLNRAPTIAPTPQIIYVPAPTPTQATTPAPAPAR